MIGDKTENIKVEFLPKGVANPEFQQRESGVFHTPYSTEVEFYSRIKDGDLNGVKDMMSSFIDNALVVGRMSNDNIRQAQYLAVSCITLATRYAIEGGLEESEAYNLSDKYIQQIDAMGDIEQILAFLSKKALELTILVKDNKIRLAYPPLVIKAIKTVEVHLHENLKCEDVAEICNVSVDYLALQFKKYVGESLYRYIIDRKLEEARRLVLTDGVPVKDIAYYLGFCSQTHFIALFKKKYNITPKEMKKGK